MTWHGAVAWSARSGGRYDPPQGQGWDTGLVTPAEFQALAATAPWTSSRGYWNARGSYQVGAHEYLIRARDAELWDLLVAHVEAAEDGFDDVYPPLVVAPGATRRWQHHYLVRGEYVYWVMRPRTLNRERVAGSWLAKLVPAEG